MGAWHSRSWIFLHGFMQDARTWKEVILPPRAVVPDYTCGTDGRMDTLIEAVHQTVQAQESKPVLVGYSMGGRVATMYALRYPKTLAGLVLESAGLGCADEKERACMTRRNEAWAEELDKTDARGFSAFVETWEALPLFASQRFLPVSAQERQRAMRLSCDPTALAAQLRFAGVQTMPLESVTTERLTHLPFPVFYIAGTHDTKYRAVAQRLAQICCVRLCEAGHNVHMENPQAFSAILREEIS